MRALVYKRTHTGDPDEGGRFGIRDCMGQVRAFDYEAVIGIGGIGSQAKAAGIDGKVSWIGIGPRKVPFPGKRGPLVTFDHFLPFDEEGPDFRTVAPTLAKRMYSRNGPRFLFDSFGDVEQAEIDRLLGMAETEPPSGGSARRPHSHAKTGGCHSKRC